MQDDPRFNQREIDIPKWLNNRLTNGKAPGRPPSLEMAKTGQQGLHVTRTCNQHDVMQAKFRM
jgi:hypothetical protein